jgi:sugar/nucleoside kinase (ribokinase family)
LTEPAQPDYLLIGHLTKDLVAEHDPGGAAASTRPTQVAAWRPGGTVLYAGVTAHRLGRRVAIVTRHGPDLAPLADLAGIQVHTEPSHATTTFAFAPTGHRELRLVARGADITSADVPEKWRRAPIVHLASVFGEVPPAVATIFDTSWIGATAQGWLRGLAHRASASSWPHSAPPQASSNRAGEVDLHPGSGRPGDEGEVQDRLSILLSALKSVNAVVLSEDDLAEWSGVPTALGTEALAEQVPLLVVTRGALGSTVFHAGRAFHIPAFPAHEVDATGAGDVFAASFFIRFAETTDPLESARFASCVAAFSVEGIGVSHIPPRQRVVEALEAAHAA